MEGLVERATLSDGGGWVGGDGLFGVNTMTPRWALIPHQWRPALGRLLRVEVLACDPPPLPPLALIFFFKGFWHIFVPIPHTLRPTLDLLATTRHQQER